jgi:hypothetical protein
MPAKVCDEIHDGPGQPGRAGFEGVPGKIKNNTTRRILNLRKMSPPGKAEDSLEDMDLDLI